MTLDQRYLAVGGDIPHFGLLPDSPIKQWCELNQFLTNSWKDSLKHNYLIRINGCLEKLSAALLQISRMRCHHDELLKVISNNAGKGVSFLAYQGAIALADFEALLLQGRAALDRLTWFIADQFKNKCSSFKTLRNILENFGNKDGKVRKLISVIDESKIWFDGLFGQIDSPEALRDLVSHKHALSEGVQNCFGINFIEPKRAIIFDCEIRLPKEIKNTPLFKASRDSAQYLPFIILNGLSILTDHDTLSLKDYETKWINRTVAIGDFVIDEPKGSPLTKNSIRYVKQMTPDGFQITTSNFDPNIQKFSIQI